MHVSKTLIALLLSYLILATLYATLVPLWETPDEPAHYRYVMQLAEHWRPPADPLIRPKDRFCKDYTFTSSNYEWYHPALGYLPLAIVYKILSAVAPHSLPLAIPPLNPLFCSDPFTNTNLFYLEASHPWEVWQHRWGVLILRIFSALYGGWVIIYATYRIGRLLKMDGFEIVAAAWVALLPQFIFINASVRNDTFSNAISALLLFLTAEMQFSHKHRLSLLVVIGLVLGIGILTKLTVIYLMPVVLVGVILAPSRSLRERIQSAACILGIASSLVALYYIRYPEAQAAFVYTSAEMRVRPESLSWPYWKPFLPMLIDLFFARFGWANILVPTWWIRIALWIWGLGTGFSLYQIIRSLKRGEDMPKIRIMILLLASLFLAFVGMVRYNFSHFQPQGRFLFPALASWAILGTWGFATVLPKRTRPWVGLVLMGFLLLFNLQSLATLVSAYF